MKKSDLKASILKEIENLKEAAVATGNECTTCKDCKGGCKYNDCSSGYCVDQGSAPKSSKSKSKDKPKRKLHKEANYRCVCGNGATLGHIHGCDNAQGCKACCKGKGGVDPNDETGRTKDTKGGIKMAKFAKLKETILNSLNKLKESKNN